jgi:hypothetical protein
MEMRRHPNSPQGRLGIPLGPVATGELWEMTPTIGPIKRGWILRGPNDQRAVLWLEDEGTAEAVRALLDRRAQTGG